jgi:hypothetical protein
MEIKISPEELRKNKVFLASPMYGGASMGIYTRAVCDLTAMFTQMQIPLVHYYLFNESLVTRARNYACDEFVRSDCTHMLFIDADIGFKPQDVLAMLALQTSDSAYDILSAPYPKKCVSWEKIVQAVEKGFHKPEHGGPNNLDNFVGDFVFNPAGGQTQIQIGEPAEVLEAGTGFMMIRRKTFEMFREAYPQYSYKPDHIRTEHFDGSREIMCYFQAEIDRYDPVNLYEEVLKDIAAGKITGSIAAQEALDKAKSLSKNDTKRYLSEDYFFCQMIRKTGGKVWLLPWMSLQHVGSFVFGGSLAHLASCGAAATADPSALGKKPTGQI